MSPFCPSCLGVCVIALPATYTLRALHLAVYAIFPFLQAGRGRGDVLPIKINASATNAVPLSFARFRIIAKGMKRISSAKMSHLVSIKTRHSVTARMNACRFCAMKMVYADYISLVLLHTDTHHSSETSVEEREGQG